MLNIYFFLEDFTSLRKKCTIDLSLVPINSLANECDQILQHHQECIIFLGYLEPGWMLDPKDEGRIRRLIRKFECHLICFHLESLPFSWKNEIEFIYSKNQKNGSTEVINNGCTLQHEL
jgi:hypothetical protein